MDVKNDFVEWSSQAGGFDKKKIGEVAVVVPAGADPFAELRAAGLPRKDCAFDGGLPRNHESYIVAVRRTPKSKPRYYWPRVANLKKVGE